MIDAPDPPPRPAPDEAALHEAALAYLSRFAATETTLRRVLERRVQRWLAEARRAGLGAEEVDLAAQTASRAAGEVARRLRAAGAVDDAGFARARAARLQRAGRSNRAIAAHLAARGVTLDLAGDALSPDASDRPDATEAPAELGAALAFARRRHIGPFRSASAPDGPETRQRELAMLARAGFPRGIATRALATGRDEAEQAVRRLRAP